MTGDVRSFTAKDQRDPQNNEWLMTPGVCVRCWGLRLLLSTPCCLFFKRINVPFIFKSFICLLLCDFVPFLSLCNVPFVSLEDPDGVRLAWGGQRSALLAPSFCQDHLGLCVCSLQAFVLVVPTSCFILKSGVILVFPSSFPPA